jgi:signal transduction histidine kinase
MEARPTMPPPDSTSAPNSDLLAWRRKALSILLWVVASVRLAQFARLLINGSFGEIPLSLRVVFCLLLGLILGMAIFRDLPHHLRGWVLVSLGYAALIAVFSADRQLHAPLLLMLLAIPVHAAIFLGRRSSWLASGISVLLMAGMAFAPRWGLHPIPDNSGPADISSDLVLSWLVTFLPLMFILDRFTGLLHRLVATESAMRLRLQAEAEERRYLEAALMETSERERQAVGHELHDGICQQITSAMLQCKVAERAAAMGTIPEPQHLRMISNLLDGSLGQAHDLARGLSPGTLAPEALVPSLRDLARRTRETYEVECEVQVSACPERLEPAAATHLYRIAHEAVINAVKHGEPLHILVRLFAEGEQLVLEVSNDGRGLSAPSQGKNRQSGDGMGLRIMRHRSDLLGGIFELISGTGKGVRVRCSVPLEQVACRVVAP